MNGPNDPSYYADLLARVTAMVSEFAQKFPSDQIDLLLELAEMMGLESSVWQELRTSEDTIGPQGLIERKFARTGPLVLTRQAVARVVDALRSATITPEAAQTWASFVRRGYVAQGVHGPVRPLEIEFEPAGADQIADAVSRLDEIGDQVDGDGDASELDELARLLAE